MAKLPTLKPKLATLPSTRKAMTTREVRTAGRSLQARRMRIWSRDPHCAMCGRLVAYPHGFELDHKVPLFQGGEDTDANCQILCVGYDEAGRKVGCHAEKTAREAKAAPGGRGV